MDPWIEGMGPCTKPYVLASYSSPIDRPGNRAIVSADLILISFSGKKGDVFT
jgi:hypothetical protein